MLKIPFSIIVGFSLFLFSVDDFQEQLFETWGEDSSDGGSGSYGGPNAYGCEDWDEELKDVVVGNFSLINKPICSQCGRAPTECTTLDHVFLDETNIRGFERYVGLMFGPYDGDMCYFKILRTLLPDHYANLNAIVKRGKYLQLSPSELYKVLICLIPVIEFHALEDYSSVYNVKSSCVSLGRMHIRLKLNSFFLAVIELLNCTENDLVEVLYNKGVLPSKNFQLISTQKELTIGLKMTRSCGGLLDDLRNRVEKALTANGSG